MSFASLMSIEPKGGKPHPDDPFLKDYDHDCIIIVDDRPDLSNQEKYGELTPELRSWLIQFTPGAMFDYRVSMANSKNYLIFAFKKPSHVLMFKMKWWNAPAE